MKKNRLPLGREDYAAHGRLYVRTTETSWRRADGDAVDELQRRLRYGKPTRDDILDAADFVTAYCTLIWKPRHIREAVVRAVRRAAELEDKPVSQSEQEGEREEQARRDAALVAYWERYGAIPESDEPMRWLEERARAQAAAELEGVREHFRICEEDRQRMADSMVTLTDALGGLMDALEAHDLWLKPDGPGIALWAAGRKARAVLSPPSPSADGEVKP